MAMRRAWCEICRGEADGGADLKKCPSCPRKFHEECCEGIKDSAQCPFCAAEGDDSAAKSVGQKAKAATRRVRTVHNGLRARSSTFFRNERASLEPFVPTDRLDKLTAKARQFALAEAADGNTKKSMALRIAPSESYIKADLRPCKHLFG